LKTLIPTCRHHSGWFTCLPDNDPDVYSTHHFLRLCEHLDISPHDPTSTIETLQKSLLSDFQDDYYRSLSSPKQVFVRDYYNAVSSIELLDGTVPDAAAVVDAVLTFETSDGSFGFSMPREAVMDQESGTVLATEYAVVVLSLLGHTDRVGQETVEWIASEWREHSGRDEVDVSRLKSLVRIKRTLPQCTGPSSAVVGAIADRVAARVRDDDVSRRLVDQLEYLLETGLLTAGELPTDLPSKVLDHQLVDGGYNIADMGFAEPHGTAVHVGVLRDLVDGESSHGPTEIVDKHDLRSGGFAQAYETATSLDESYYDAEISRVLGLSHAAATPPNEVLDDLLSANPRTLGPLRKVVRVCGLDEDQRVTEAVDEVVDSALDAGDLSLARLHDLVKLGEAVGYEFDAPAVSTAKEFVRGVRNPDGGYGIDESTQIETFYATGVLAALFSRFDREQTTEWVGRRRVDGSGYGAVVDDDLRGPFLQNTFLCTSILSRLGQQIPDEDAIVGFVLSHGTDNGGFCSTVEDRREYGDRTMQFSYWAIKTLENVEQL
jgi:hypothetical protein